MRWMLPLLIGVVIAAAGLFYARRVAEVEQATHRATVEADLETRLRAAIHEQQARVDTLRERFERVDDLKTAQERALRQARNVDHLAAARRLGIPRPATPEVLERLLEEGRLVRLEDNDRYYVQDLDLSVPYVTPDLAAALEEMGRRMHETLAEQGLPPFRFNISSVLRSSENQADLRRINPNAARGTSAHEFGTTVDVVYHTYDFGPDSLSLRESGSALDSLLASLQHRAMHGLAMIYWQELQGVLGRVLIEMQREGRVLVTLEREQPVFHITVARPAEGA